MAAFGATAVPAPPPAPAAAGWSPPPASAAQLPRGSPQPLKRPRPDDDDAQQQWQQQQQAAAQQLRAQRRRLDGGPDSPAPAFGLPPFPTPQPFQQQAQQQAQHQHAQQQAQQQPSQWPSSADLELEPASSMEAASSLEEEDGGAQGPAARRARTGAPEYRLVLPDALPPPIPASLLASAAQPWGAGAPPGLQPPAGDAWALVPWSPPLVAAQDLQRQQREQEESKERLKAQHLALRRLQLRYDHEQPLPDAGAGTAMDRVLGTSAGVRIEELPPQQQGDGGGDAMEE